MSVTTPSLPAAKQRSLLFKHEILSPECDLFRACLPRRIYFRRLGRLLGLLVAALAVGHWWFGVKQITEGALMMAVMISIIFYMLSQTIEGTNIWEIIHFI